MGPQSLNLTLDEMLQVMAWVRHVYKDGIGGAAWLTDAEKKTFKPYDANETIPENAPGLCSAAK